MFYPSDNAIQHLCNALSALRTPSKLLENYGLIATDQYIEYDEEVPCLRRPTSQELKQDLERARKENSEQLRNLCCELLRRRNDASWYDDNPLDYRSAAAFHDPLIQFQAELLNDGYKLSDDGFAIIELKPASSVSVFPAGTPHDAFTKISAIFGSATTEIFVTDNYLDGSVLDMLAAVPSKLSIKLLTAKTSPDFKTALKQFRLQYGHQIEVRNTKQVHDRAIVIDNKDFYALGASIKDAGSKLSLLSKLQDVSAIAKLQTELQRVWTSASVQSGFLIL